MTGSDEFYLGARRRAFAPDAMLPTEVDRRDRIAKALAEVLVASTDRDLSTASMVGLAKIGMDPPGRNLAELLSARLAESNQEVRETAALAMGIAGLQDAWPVLAALLKGDAEGRKLVGGKEAVPERSRTFAAWSIGLLAGRSTEGEAKQKAFELLKSLLEDPSQDGRDLRVGLVHAIGLLEPVASRSAKERRLLFEAVDALWAFYERDLGKGDQIVQAHVPAAIVRLLGRGNGAMHQRAKERLVRELTAEGRSNALRESAALALGALCMPSEECPADAEVCKALRSYYENGTDEQARHFCIASLGRIGGAANRAVLMQLYARGNRAIERPWIGIALGLIAHHRRMRDPGDLDLDVGRMLHDDFRSIDVDTTRAACALAIGLCGYLPAATDVRAKLAERPKSDTLAGYLALALSMLGDRTAADEISSLMREALRRPFVLQQCAAALGHLGDTEAVPLLLEMLERSESMATMAAIASALGELRDRRSIDPLLKALHDPNRSSLARAFAAAALGGVGDKDELRWNAAIAREVNYGALVDTLGDGSTGVLDIL